MKHETGNHTKSSVSKSVGVGKMVNMKETKEQKERSWEKSNALVTSKAYNRKDFDAPDGAQDQKRQEFIPLITFHQEKYHTDHDWTKQQGLDKVRGNQISQGQSDVDSP